MLRQLKDCYRLIKTLPLSISCSLPLLSFGAFGYEFFTTVDAFPGAIIQISLQEHKRQSTCIFFRQLLRFSGYLYQNHLLCVHCRRTN